MKIEAIKTRKVVPPKDEIWDILDGVASTLGEEQIVVVTSKIVSLHEGRTVSREQHPDKDKLVEEEAELFLPREEVPGEHVTHSITRNSWVSTAGIDGSNAKGYWVMYPEDPFKSAKEIWEYLKEKSGKNKFGVLITDSHSVPLRRGASGFALALWGFNPMRSYIGEPDIFGEKLKVSVMDVAGNLAGAATFAMGEGKEQTPIAIISGVEGLVEFTDKEISIEEYIIPPEEDLFNPFYKIFKKKT